MYKDEQITNSTNFIFLQSLKKIKEFEYSIEIVPDFINAEKNLSHFFHLQFVEEAKMKFGKTYIPHFIKLHSLGSLVEPLKTKIHYKKDFILGDTVVIKISVKDEKNESFYLEFQLIRHNTNDVHAYGYQIIRKDGNFDFDQISTYSRHNNGHFMRKIKTFFSLADYPRTLKGGFYHKLKVIFFLLRNYIHTSEGRYLYQREVGFSLTNITSHLKIWGFALLLGDARESFAKSLIPFFTKDVGMEYLLKTYKAEYNYFGHFKFGDIIQIRIRITGVERCWFLIKAEFVNDQTGEVYAIASQTIAYADNSGKLAKIPESIKRLLWAFMEIGK